MRNEGAETMDYSANCLVQANTRFITVIVGGLEVVPDNKHVYKVGGFYREQHSSNV